MVARPAVTVSEFEVTVVDVSPALHVTAVGNVGALQAAAVALDAIMIWPAVALPAETTLRPMAVDRNVDHVFAALANIIESAAKLVRLVPPCVAPTDETHVGTVPFDVNIWPLVPAVRFMTPRPNAVVAAQYGALSIPLAVRTEPAVPGARWASADVLTE